MCCGSSCMTAALAAMPALSAAILAFFSFAAYLVNVLIFKLFIDFLGVVG